MKKQFLTCAILFTLGLNTANAGFGAFASKLTDTLSPEKNTTLTSSSDYVGFFTQAKETQSLFLESRTVLASLLTSKEQSAELKNKLKALKTTSDPKEKQSLVKDLNELSGDVLEASQKDETATAEQISQLSSEQKTLLVDSGTNFVIASLKARDLALNSKAVSASLITNPKGLMDAGLSLTDAKNLIGDVSGIAKNAGMALVEYPRIFKKAGIDFKVPESASTKPVTLPDDF